MMWCSLSLTMSEMTKLTDAGGWKRVGDSGLVDRQWLVAIRLVAAADCTNLPPSPGLGLCWRPPAEGAGNRRGAGCPARHCPVRPGLTDTNKQIRTLVNEMSPASTYHTIAKGYLLSM